MKPLSSLLSICLFFTLQVGGWVPPSMASSPLDHPTGATLFPNNREIRMILPLFGQTDYQAVKSELREVFPFQSEKIDYLGFRDMTFTVPGWRDASILVTCHHDDSSVWRIIVNIPKTFDGTPPYLQLFGSSWDEELELVENHIDNLELGYRNDDTTHEFVNNLENGQLKLTHLNERYEWRIFIQYKGDGPLNLDDPKLLKFSDSVVGGNATGLKLLKDPLSELVFPNHPDLTFLVQQLGRSSSRDMIYEFTERVDQAEYTGMGLNGWSRSDPDVYVIFSLDAAAENWTKLWVSAPLQGTQPNHFGLFHLDWSTECGAMEKTGRLEKVTCEETRHVFSKHRNYEITHMVIDGKETVEVRRTDNTDFAQGEWNQFAVGGSFPKTIEFKGPHLEDGTPHGAILAKFPLIEGGGLVELELEVDHGKVINPPEPYFEFKISNRGLYKGQLDPDTWEPRGIGRYEIDQSTEHYTDRITITGEYFEGFRQPDLSRQYVVENATLDTPYPGTLVLWNLKDLKIGAELAFEGMALLYPDADQQERYAGYFSIVSQGANWRDDRSYASGKHLYQKLVDGEWQTVETSTYDIIEGTISGRNFYGDSPKPPMDYQNRNFFGFPHLYQYSDAKKAQFVETVRNIFEAMSVPGKPIGTRRYRVPTENYMGYMGENRSEPSLRPKFELPGFAGSTKFHAWRKKWYQVDYVKIIPDLNEQPISEEVNKVVMALMEASRAYFGDELEADRFILDREGNLGRSRVQNMRLNFDAGVQYQFEQSRRWGPFITVFVYRDPEKGRGQITVSFRQTFKDRSEYDKYD